jgi:hypothetical protein
VQQCSEVLGEVGFNHSRGLFEIVLGALTITCARGSWKAKYRWEFDAMGASHSVVIRAEGSDLKSVLNSGIDIPPCSLAMFLKPS